MKKITTTLVEMLDPLVIRWEGIMNQKNKTNNGMTSALTNELMMR